MAQEIATLAGGCFWCTEAVFNTLKGVLAVESGYIGGHKANPNYEEACTRTTGPAEALSITFATAFIRYVVLLDVLSATHAPTTSNRQGNAEGTILSLSIFPVWHR